jgi:hypothetical protein
MRKPNSSSVTTKPCKCGWLEREAAEAGSSIRFDEDLNEFHILNRPPDRGYLLIYHCLFCGGAAPRSRRATLFARPTRAELDRLERVVSGLTSVAQAVKKLGKPKSDRANRLRTMSAGSNTEAPKAESFRVMVFTNVSRTTDVHLTDYGRDGIRFTFQGKYLGRPKSREV